MPFPNVTEHGIEKNFEQVLNGLIHYVRPVLAAGELIPYEGWALPDYLSALETQVGQSSDRLWTAAITDKGESKADLLATRLDAAELQLSRMAEQISSLQIKGGI